LYCPTIHGNEERAAEISAKIRILILTLAVAATWFVLGTVYLDRFPPVLSRLELSLLPWKQHLPAEANLDQRLDLMQQQLDLPPGSPRTHSPA
jgi:hypothetical protein